MTGNISQSSIPLTQSSILTPLLPPLPGGGGIPVLPKVASMSEATSPDESRSKSEPGLDCLENVLQILEGKLISGLKGDAKVDEISKRLENMANSWREGKLNNDICQRLATLSECLKHDCMNDEQFSSALDIVQSLACDYSTECVGWIIGLKHLILKVKESPL